MTDVIYLAPLCQEHERMWCEHDAPVDCECIDGPHPWIKYVAAPQQPAQGDVLKAAGDAIRGLLDIASDDNLDSAQAGRAYAALHDIDTALKKQSK